jgi:hypothetical protein
MPNPHISTTITCAAPNCGHVRGINNHWFMLRDSGDDKWFTLCAWNPDLLISDRDRILPLCGDACVHVMIQKYLSGQKWKSSLELSLGLGPRRASE